MKKLLVLFAFCGAIPLFAQDTDPIATDRPTQSAGSTVVPKGNALIEYGFIYENARDITNVTFANFLARVGLLNGVEIRITQNIQQVKNDLTDTKEDGLSPITIGTKIHLLSENGAVPQASIIGQVTLANGNEAFRPDEAIPEVRLNFSNTLSDFLSLGYNIGMAFPEESNTALYSVVLGYSFSPGWTVFAEPYGFFQDSISDHRFNTGLIYLVSNNVQFDISAGVGLSDVSPDSFIGFGAAIGF
ncbi:transporter [Ekhidna sp. To15]|uniref:transporter n=1 Tax=Ekhidna sp. To15 TaxID=3395267 RepID=UPI003F525F9E